jgi:hypothetical protein
LILVSCTTAAPPAAPPAAPAAPAAPADPDAECRAPAEAIVKLWRGTGPRADERRSNGRAVIMARCIEDGWTDANRRCMAAATSDDARVTCFRSLTDEQQDRRARALSPFLHDDATVDPITRDELMAKFESFRDQMCACKDKTCAERVAAEMTTWSKQQSKDKNPPRMTDEDTQRASRIGETMGRCMQAVMSAQ